MRYVTHRTSIKRRGSASEDAGPATGTIPQQVDTRRTTTRHLFRKERGKGAGHSRVGRETPLSPFRGVCSQDVRIFLMNDSVDLAREACKPPEGYDQDLAVMLRDLIARGVPVKVCGTGMARCGIHKNQPYVDGAHTSTMAELAAWVIDTDKIITF